ncbi:alpha/beta hydrolase [Corynebacterium halotolerans]|uniref:Surface layer protein n=2 Tax=Corynebacterium halotolerans TaxID=225326 RepID=M1NQX5_9CORY|nr:alpha/beta hydrolase family protein [Corynebacterium halotolerans]AGF71922.1 surface layer protein [Corynebacterium halotolerans YIM 70093 = DSM 44683]
MPHSRRLPTAVTTVFSAMALLAPVAAAPALAQDHGMDPDVVSNPADTPDRPEGPSSSLSSVVPDNRFKSFSSQGSSDATVYDGIIADYRPQEINPMFPDGRDHLPKAELDMDPEILARLETWAHVDGERIRQINAYSPSMGRTIPLVWVVPEDLSEPRPVVYALGGADGGQGHENWITRSNMVDFYSEKNIHVIMPMLGAFSFYSDWLEEHPDQGGKQMWETFLTHELPEPLEDAIGGDGQRSLIGMSMSGTTALLYATHRPGFYDSVASLSGCGDTNSWVGRRGIASTLYNGNGTPEMMWGEPNSDYSRYQDAVVNAHRLADQPNLYVYAASGLVGPADYLGPNAPTDDAAFQDRSSVGFTIEAGSNLCAHRLKQATDAHGIDSIYYDFATTGTHSWDAWSNALKEFWPIQARGFGMDGGEINPELDVETPPWEGSTDLDRYNDLSGPSSAVTGGSSVPQLSSLSSY